MVKADNWSKEPNVYREAFSFKLYCSSTSSTAGGSSKVSRLLVQGWGWGVVGGCRRVTDNSPKLTELSVGLIWNYLHRDLLISVNCSAA